MADPGRTKVHEGVGAVLGWDFAAVDDSPFSFSSSGARRTRGDYPG